MKIKSCETRMSGIVKISEQLRKLSSETNTEYLFLNRGINAVCNIDLSEVIKNIDFNDNSMQVYQNSRGRFDLREAINDEFFCGKSSIENISVTVGGVGGLDISFQTLDVDKIYFPDFFWGTYQKITSIRKKESATYQDFDELRNNLSEIKNSAVIICDPSNPLGSKIDDNEILETVKLLNDNGTVVIIDSPYRRIFFDKTDCFYAKMLDFKNVIIIESFSKSIGLSGQRLGFVHCKNKAFNTDFAIRLLFSTNGVNAFAQILVRDLLTTEAGKKAVKEFKEKTRWGIQKNINFLIDNNLLVKEFYKESKPWGIFVAINKTQDELIKHKIGSVAMDYFTQNRKEEAMNYSRLCVSVSPEKFREFFENIL